MNLKASCSIITIAMCLATILSKPVSASFFHTLEHIGGDILDRSKKFIAHPIDTIEDDLKTVEQKAVDIAVNGFILTIIGGLPSGDISTSTSSRSSSESDKQYKPNIVEHIPSLIMQSITKESIKSYGEIPIINPIHVKITGLNERLKEHGLVTAYITHHSFINNCDPIKNYEVVKFSHSILINPLKKNIKIRKKIKQIIITL